MPHKMKLIGLALPGLVLVLAALSAAPVLAREAASGGGNGHLPDDRQVVTTAGTNKEISSSPEKTPKIERSTVSELRAKAEQEVNSRKKEQKVAQTKENRLKKCEARRDGLNTKFNNIEKNAQRYQDRLNEINTKVADYIKTSGTTGVTGLAGLQTNVTAAQTASQTAIGNLVNLKPAADALCNSNDPAAQIAAYKAAAQQVRNNLDAYKAALKAEIKALLEVKTTTGAQ